MRQLLLAAALLACCAPCAPASERVLLTGDSMMENIGTPLAAALRARGDTVVLDHQAGSGISIPVLDWTAYARKQVAADDPDLTVMFNGAGDVDPVDGTTCCGPAWRRAYGRRVVTMMRTYRRRGRRVLWLTQPTPRNRGYANVLAAVNRAFRDAARAAGARVTILDTVPVLSPGRRFDPALRARDGIHLAPPGTRLVVARVLRALAARSS